MRNDLEMMAVDMARETGCDLETARLAIRVTLLKLRLGLGQMTIAEVNAQLAPLGLKMVVPS